VRFARVQFDGAPEAARVLEESFVIHTGPHEGIEVGPHEVSILPPAVPTKIVAVGWNFPKHIDEMVARLPKDKFSDVPEEPIIFLKPPSSMVAHGEPIVYPREATKVEHEGELCVIIGRSARRVSPSEARDVVLGWTCGNDVTERDMQRKDRQWWRAKGFDTFAAAGPYLETDAPDPDARITTVVNGSLRQEGRVRDMLRDPWEIISYVSRAMTLLPGDLLMLGTPPGVGELHPGDTVVVEIEGLEPLCNPVVAETVA
jgi:2-keto-4-pentenoate hydratase/2-oxohepta-3-ene-1,7-dioic acid hydratase in catechol pathway